MPPAEPPHFRMRRMLDRPIAVAPLPAGTTMVPFAPAIARGAHAVIVAAYAEPALPVPTFEAWWDGLVTDSEYDPALVLVAAGQDGSIAGLAQCWTSAFVKDLAVHPGWQRRGVGTALLTRTFAAFAACGSPHVDLKVAVHNRAAQRFYRCLGMLPVDGPDQPVG